MKFALGRTSQSQQPVAMASGSAASTALQQSSRQQQQARQLQALKHGNAALIQHKPDESMVSQQAALEDEEPVQGKFETAQQMSLEDEEPMQGKFDAAIQRQPDEEEPLQGKFEPAAVNQRQADAAPANNTGMPDQLKTGIESLSGYAMDDVKVHYNSAKPAQMQAHAYAQGTDIHIAPGQEQHLPHEAWHVVQQKQGRVKATTQLKGEAINDDPGLEHEADVMGAKALQPKLKPNGSQQATVTSDTIQKMKVDGKDVVSTVSGTTNTKHVVADGNQAATAQANYGDSTFVRAGNLLTAVIDADNHDWVGVVGQSARHDINANVVIDLWKKTQPAPGGLAIGQPVAQSIVNTSTACEIGAKKYGDGTIKVCHFKKL